MPETRTVKSDPTPQPKVATASGFGVALAVIVVALLKGHGVAIDETVRAAIEVLCVFGVGYFTPQASLWRK